MKITKRDRIILEWLRNKLEGDSSYNMAFQLNVDVAYIYRRLERMVNYKVLEKIYGKPTFYKINKRYESKLVLKFIKCPKCEEISCVDFNQITRLCKCGKRFYIYKNRIVDIKYI